MPFRIKRVYEPAVPADGLWVLVDRLWPRGIRKDDSTGTEWAKDVAPSADLRRGFGHEPERFAEFARRFKQELRGTTALKELRTLGRRRIVTLLYGARDPRVNHAVVLLSVLTRRPTVGPPTVRRPQMKSSGR